MSCPYLQLNSNVCLYYCSGWSVETGILISGCLYCIIYISSVYAESYPQSYPHVYNLSTWKSSYFPNLSTYLSTTKQHLSTYLINTLSLPHKHNHQLCMLCAHTQHNLFRLIHTHIPIYQRTYIFVISTHTTNCSDNIIYSWSGSFTYSIISPGWHCNNSHSKFKLSKLIYSFFLNFVIVASPKIFSCLSL